MKILIFALGLFLFFAATYAENPTDTETSSNTTMVKGRVVDATTGEALTGVEIIFPWNGKICLYQFRRRI
jgi:hypothetical protein